MVCWAKIPRFCVQPSKCNLCLYIDVNILKHWQEYSSPLLARPRRNWLRCAKVLSMQRIFLRGHKYFPHSNTASSFTCAPPPASSSEQPAWHLQPAFYFYYLIWTIAFFCIFTSPSFSSEHLKYKVEILNLSFKSTGSDRIIILHQKEDTKESFQ